MSNGGHASYRAFFTELAIGMTPVWIFLGIAFVYRFGETSSDQFDEPYPVWRIFAGSVIGGAAVLAIIRIVNRRHRVNRPAPNPDAPPESH